ncbi:TetR/AcrR family transcriptional regulator [Pendulispora brunnea]|uniref:TetR/AcrR family transcriptional regulator n=1 Tax=Pendulispora brunnea TaxID=2905690 RepID=A0ABZ2KNM6_9BACT
MNKAKQNTVKKYEGTAPREAREPRARDPERSRARILSAAMKEFALRGFAGARVDAIAKRARINKRMLYHYFGNKKELFEATILAIQADKEQIIEAGPQHVQDMLPYIYDNFGSKRDWMRMMQWEALTYGSREVPSEKMRAKLFKPGLDRVAKAQRENGLLREEKTELAMMVLMALASYPHLMPQAARMLTGHAPDEPQFRRSYSALLRRIIGYLTRP